MKKILLTMLAAVLLFSCQKKDETTALQDVSFAAIELTPEIGLKSTDSTIVCKNDVPDYAAVLISIGVVDTWYYPALFTLDGKLYTQSLKLPVGTYSVKEFFLYKNVVGTTGYEAGDIIVFATPTGTSQYAEYVSTDLEFNFTVEAFQKAQVNIEVLCFQDHLFTSFGFNWFAITEIVVRELCFFGDICVTDPTNEAWLRSLYSLQHNGIQIDMPAIFFINIKDINGDDLPYSPWGNTGWNGEGAPLCVTYPDNLSIDGEKFTLQLYLYGPVDGGGFGYTLYATYIIVDDVIYNTNNPEGINENTPILPDGADGIYDFVVGNCVNIPPDIIFPPYDPLNPPIEGTCETAFAYNQNGIDGQTRYCFLQLKKSDASYNPSGNPSQNFNRWGWTNELLSIGTYTFKIYAAAGQCDLSKGTWVGDLIVDYQNGGNVLVTYNMKPDFNLLEVHIYVGNDRLPKNGNNYVVAPGQYPWVAESLAMLSTYSHTFNGMSGNIYVVAHAVVCGVYP